MKKLLKGIMIGSIIVIGSVVLVRQGMKLGCQLYEDMKQDIIEEYKIEESRRKENNKQHMAEILTPLKPVSETIMAMEGYAC